MRVDCAVLVSLILLNLANEVASRELSGVAQRWFDDPRCECCKDGNGVPLSSLYKTEIHKNCFGGGGTEEIGWRLVDVLAQTSDGTLTVEPMAQRRVCASHRCRGSITTFWDAVHDCAASGYWKVVGLAFATAKSQCHQLDQQPQEEGQWLARIRATFHGVDTNDDAALLNLERVAERSALEALSVSSDGVPIHSSALEVKCSSVPIFKGGLGQDSVRLEAPTPPPNRTCARVTSRWPAHQEQGVAPDLKYVILHFDRCVRATNETQLVLAISPAGKNGTLKVPLKYGMADLPSETLVFPLGELELGTNRQIDLSLTGEPVRTCKDQADICEDFASTFYTVITDPAVIRTQLVADRWLRSTFDLPVEVADAKKFHVTLRPWFAGSRVAYNTAEMMLTASTHLYTVAAENDQNVVPAKDDPLHETQCVYSLEAMSDRKSCNDQRTFEADLCDVFSCKGSRIPCGGKVEVEYPEGIALRAGAGVLSVKGSGEAFSRRCAAPRLLSSIKLHVTRADDDTHPNRGLLEIAWSQPVVFNKDEGWKTFTLCHSDTRGLHCPMRDVAFSDSNVIPCTGAGGDCAVWAIKLPTADLPLCGGIEIIIEHGAVKSVDDDEPNKRSVGHINGTEPCPTWDNEMTCSLVDGDRLRADEKLLDWRSLTVSKPQLHLQTDLDRMNVKYTEISWSKHKILRRLQSQSYLPRCLIIPGLTHRLRLMPELPQALFDYVHLGGQLYMLGSPVNIQLIEKAFNFTIKSAETGNVQVRTVPSPSDALGVGAGLPEELPVLNQLLSIAFENMTSTRSGELIQANGIYTRGHVEPTVGWFGFGVVEVRTGDGFLEYLGFDWHHGTAEKRMEWAKLLQMLVTINYGRWAPPPTSHLQGHPAVNSWAQRRLQSCPEHKFPPDDAKDMTCTLSYKCQGSSARECEPQMHLLNEITSRQNALLLERMSIHCLHLTLEHFSPAFPVKLAEKCPPWGEIDEIMKEMKAACGFGYGPDASVLDVEVVKTNLGVESFSSDIRSSVCEQSFCRGQIARMAQIFQRCPGEAGVKGERARLARMLLRTVHSCTRAGGAVLNVQDSFVLKGVNVLNPGEHDGLAAAVQEALAAQMPWPRGLHVWLGRLARSLLDWPVNVVAWLGGVPAAAAKSARSMVTVNVRPRYPSAEVWSRTAGWSDSTSPAGQEAVAFVPEHLPGGACQGCSVRNLQVLAVHPAIGAEGVDPAGVIRIFFDSVIVVDNPNAEIRIYPKALEKVCEEAEVNPFVYYPWDTGTGEVQVATQNRHATRMAPGIPIRAVCQVHRVSDSLVQVGDEVLQITPRHPLMRNAEIVVQIAPWAVRAANLRDEERYPARWTGWMKQKEQSRELLTFKTGSPSNSFAEVSLAMGCTPALCAESQQQLSQASESLAERMECFLSWYRCSGDSTSPKLCDERERRIPEWCNIYAADWRTMAASAPAFGEFNDKEITSAEPLELRSDTRRGRPIPPFGLWVLTVVAFMSGCFAVYRAALWLSDEYLASREFDPYLINQLAFYPLYILVAFGLVPILVAFNAAFLAPIFYHRALQLQCNHSSKIGGWHNLQVGAAAEFNRLQAQMTWAGNVGLGSAVSVMALLSYATIGMSHKSNFDRGQIAAAVAFILAWGSIIGGAGNWIAESSPLVHDQMDSREKHFEVAVLSICGTGLLTMLASVVLLAIAAMLVTLMFSGIGPILHHFLHYTWMQWTSWYDPRTFKPLLGKWYTWILHIRDLHLLHGFRVLLDGQLREDGFVRIDFYMSNDSYNTVSTRTVPVRAFTQKNMNPFEGDNICLNVLNWRSIMWIDVMYQSTPGAHARRVAGAVWDPWTGSLLQKCFLNVKICEPHIGTDRGFPGQQVKLWEFEDLIDADGMPKDGHYVEQRVNLMPNGGDASSSSRDTATFGLLSLQMTHLGPRQVLEERDDPSDQPSVELFLGDTIASSAGVGFARRAHKHHETPTSPSGSIVGLVSKVSGYWTVDKGGIGGVELEMHHEMPKRYGWNNGKHQWAELEPSEWIVAVHQQQQEKYPNQYGKALAFFTSTGKIRQFAVPSAMKLNHLAAPRGFQIRKLVFSGPRLQSIQVNPVDGKGFEKVNWYVDEEVEFVEFCFKDGSREAHGQKSGKSTSVGSTRHCIETCEYFIGVTQEESSGSRIARSLVIYTSRGKAFRMAGKSAEDKGAHLAVEEGKQVVGLKWNSFKLEGFDVGPAREWK